MGKQGLWVKNRRIMSPLLSLPNVHVSGATITRMAHIPKCRDAQLVYLK